MWKDYEQYMESCWKDESPVYISQELQQAITVHPDFSTTPIGPIENCTISEQLRKEIPESLATSYIVNSQKDVTVLHKLVSAYNEPQPTIITYSFNVQHIIIMMTISHQIQKSWQLSS